MKYIIYIKYYEEHNWADYFSFAEQTNFDDVCSYLESRYSNLACIKDIKVIDIFAIHDYKHIQTRNDRLAKKEELRLAKEAEKLEAEERAELARLQEKYGIE